MRALAPWPAIICLIRRFAIRPHMSIRRYRNADSLITPGLHKAMHVVVRPTISLSAQFFEQSLGRAAFAAGELGFCLQYPFENIKPFAQLRHRLHRTLICELGLLTADDLAHRRARFRKEPNDLLDRAVSLKIGTSYLANQIPGNHALVLFRSTKGQRKRTLPHDQ